jgi:hypothetical protein
MTSLSPPPAIDSLARSDSTSSTADTTASTSSASHLDTPISVEEIHLAQVSGADESRAEDIAAIKSGFGRLHLSRSMQGLKGNQKKEVKKSGSRLRAFSASDTK